MVEAHFCSGVVCESSSKLVDNQELLSGERRSVRALAAGPKRKSDHSARQKHPGQHRETERCTSDVDVLPSYTSWLCEPTTGAHAFGGGSAVSRQFAVS